MTAVTWQKTGEGADSRVRAGVDVAFWSMLLVVFVVQLALALWLNSRDYFWGDAESRAASALIALYSADPHLAAIGFVWMPLPTFFELLPVSFYPLWNDVVASGFAASLSTVLCGTATAAIVYATARRFGLSTRLTAVYALLVSFSPMILLYSTNGMSEGVAAPFMVGSVCCLLLFWHEGQRWYVALSGVFLALSFACLYQAAHLGAALLVALVAGIYSSENRLSAWQGRLRAVQGLSILLLVPSVYFAMLWVIANAVIMGDPFYFATSSYSNEGYIAATGVSRVADAVRGDVMGSLWFVLVRTAPFFIPIAFILCIRLIEGRLIRFNTATLLGLALVVPFGLILPQLYAGQSFGWLRYFSYPLYVAAGWGLYEIARSRRRGLAIGLVMSGWLLAIPAGLWAMASPDLGQQEYQVVRGLLNGDRAAEVGYPMYFADVVPVARAIDALATDDLVLMDSSNAWTVASIVEPETLGRMLVLTSDKRFHEALSSPREAGVDYMLVPNPGFAPQDLLNGTFPGLWEGREPGFTLVQDFSQTGVHWRLYSIDP